VGTTGLMARETARERHATCWNPNSEELQGPRRVRNKRGPVSEPSNFLDGNAARNKTERSPFSQVDERLCYQTFRRPASGPPMRGLSLEPYTRFLGPHGPRRLTHPNRRSFTDALDRLRSVRSTWAIYLGEAN
jgi:hypothetical protein